MDRRMFTNEIHRSSLCIPSVSCAEQSNSVNVSWFTTNLEYVLNVIGAFLVIAHECKGEWNLSEGQMQNLNGCSCVAFLIKANKEAMIGAGD